MIGGVGSFLKYTPACLTGTYMITYGNDYVCFIFFFSEHQNYLDI